MSMLILTDTGQAKVAAALAGGQPVRIEEVVAGDGGISTFAPASPQPPVWQPDAALTALPGERWRGAPVDIHSDDTAGEVIITAVIPQQAGGWWLHAAGLIDDAGDLIAVAALEPVYVSTHRELTLTLRLVVSQASAISLQVPPTALATREWVAAALNPVPDGKLGINTTADAANRLAVKSDAMLFSHDDVTPGSGDVQFKVNKAAATNTTSLLFQTGWSGRAELGTIGDDNFRIKVSQDGAVWNDAVSIDAATGETTFNADVQIPDGVAIENRGTSSGSKLRFVGGGIFGPVSLELKNIVGLNGALFKQEGSVDLVDFGLASKSHQVNLRIESRQSYVFGSVPEFQIFKLTGGLKYFLTCSATLNISHSPLRLPSYTVQALPDAATVGAGTLIYVSDDSAGATVAFSDGTNWRRVQDGSVVA